MGFWFYAFAIKVALLPVFAFIYWLFVIKAGHALARLLPDGKLKEALTRDRTF